MTNEQVQKQFLRQRNIFHQPVKVPEGYFDINFTSPTKNDPSRSAKRKSLPNQEDDRFKMPPTVSRPKTLDRDGKRNLSPTKIPQRSQKPESQQKAPPEMSFDSDYEAWKSELEGHTSRVLNSTQYVTKQ